MAGLGLLAALVRCSDSPTSGGCTYDNDGLKGGTYTFALTVDDSGFTPSILSAQNASQVTLTLKNTGTRPHDFVVDCAPTPNTTGCPTTSCFPASSKIPPVAPGASATATFVTPSDDLYVFRSDVGSDSQLAADGGASGLVGQFNVQ